MSSKNNVIKRRKSNAIFDAIQFAVRAHTGHTRKGSDRIPYIVHPLGVAKILIEHGLPDEVVIAGVLHDTVEDTYVTLGQIRKKFGDGVAKLVDSASEPDKSLSWEERKRHTIGYLRNAPLKMIYVACADKLDNVRAMVQDYEKIGEKLFDRFNEPKAKQKWYYTSLGKVFLERSKEAGRAAGIFKEYDKAVRALFGRKST